MQEDRLRDGETFAGYLIEGTVGEGGMGTVYRAHELALNRTVALKVISGAASSDAAFAARFRREARLAASVEHRNIVPVYSAGSEADQLYLAMKLIPGSDLSEVLPAGPLEPETAIAVLRKVASGLDAAHAAGLVHRDVKPANILIEGSDLKSVYLTDFGISKIAGGSGQDTTSATGLTGIGQVLGTAGYVAPELIEDGAATSQSDVYSLACVAFETLTGRQPFARDSEVATLVAHTKAPRPRASIINEIVPASVDRALQRGMAIDPSDRPASATAFVDDLDDAFRSPRRRARSRRVIALVVALLVVAAAVALVSLATTDDDMPKTADRSARSRDAEPPTVTTASVASGPVGLAVGDGRLWVAGRDAGEIESFNAGSIDTGATSSVEVPEPRALAFGFKSTWAVNHQNLLRLAPASSHAAPIEIPVGSEPDDVAVDRDSVWVTNEGDSTLSKVDPSTSQVVASAPVANAPRSVATGGGAVWVVSDSGELTKVDPESASVIDSVSVGLRPTAVAFGNGSVWVTDNADGSLYAIDAGAAREAIGAVSQVAQTAASPRGVATGLGGVWVVSGAENVLEKFSFSGERVGGPINVGNDPADVGTGEGAVYTANFGSSTVSRVQP